MTLRSVLSNPLRLRPTETAAAATRTPADAAPVPASSAQKPVSRLQDVFDNATSKVAQGAGNLFRGLGARAAGDDLVTVSARAEVNLPIEDNKVLVSTLNVADDVDVQLLQLDLDLTHSYR